MEEKEKRVPTFLASQNKTFSNKMCWSIYGSMGCLSSDKEFTCDLA